jgi:hypothetical protein
VARDTLDSGSSARIYRRHVANSQLVGRLLGDGRPYDAGTAMLLASELNHALSECAPRQLVNDTGPGALVIVNDDWGGLNETVPPGSERAGRAHQEIAWSPTTARCYGPFPAVVDRLRSDGRLCPRSVRAAVRAKGDGANTLKVWIAATATRRPPSDGYLAFKAATLVSTTETVLFNGASSSDLEWDGLPTVRAPEPMNTVGEAADGGYVDEPRFYLWVGYKAGGATSAYITAVSFWELRPL